MSEIKPNLPGRLGTPDMALRDDPRADPRMIAAMAPFGLDGPPQPSGVTAESSDEEIYAHCLETEAGFGQVFQVVLDERFAADLDEWFRRRVREGTKPFTASGGENHGAHGRVSSKASKASNSS